MASGDAFAVPPYFLPRSLGLGTPAFRGWGTGLLLRAVLDDVAVGVAAVAHVRVAAVSAPAPEGLFEVI